MYPIEHCMKTVKGYIQNKVGMENALQKAMHWKRLWGFAPNTCKILQPQGEGFGMTKKTLQWLMKYLKEVGIHC